MRFYICSVRGEKNRGVIEKGCSCALWKRKGTPYSCEGFLNFYITKKNKMCAALYPRRFLLRGVLKKREKMRKEMYEESKKLFKRLGI